MGTGQNKKLQGDVNLFGAISDFESFDIILQDLPSSDAQETLS